MLHVTPLSAPATRVVISNVPPFIKDELIMKELARFGKFAGPMTDIPLGCKNPAVKHVLSFRRQVYMFINNGEQTLDINFKCKHGDSSYTVFATTERPRCFGCGEIGHKRLSCPRGAVQPGSSGGDTAGVQQQQRGDSQRENTGEQEPGAERGNDTPRSQQEELFVLYGNKAGNNVWGHNVPAVDQIRHDAGQQQRAAFIKAKYCNGLYRRAHPLASSQTLLNQRLCEVVCGPDVEETLSLLCSGAKVLGGDTLSAIMLAEKAGQALQTELLRHNEFIETPDFDQQRQMREQTGLEELHGRLDDERFLFSQETESAACDVLDLREVISVFNQSGQTHEFEILTLTDNLTCSADTQDQLLNHMQHIVKVVIPGPLLEAELVGVMGVSRLSLREGSGLQYTEVWVTIRPGEILIYPLHTQAPRTSIILNQHTCYSVCKSENTVEVTAAEKTLYLQFERDESCSKFYTLLSSAASSNRKSDHHSLYTLPAAVSGRVPPEVQRCISHITLYGLKVEGLYRCCGSVVKVAELVEKLRKAPDEVVLETNEVSVQEVAGALKHFLRNSPQLIPSSEREGWVKAAAQTDLSNRLQEYCRLVKHLPPDNRALLSTLFSHLYIMQLYSQVNKMTAQNLAVVFVPTLFEDLAMNISMVNLTRELIVHHTAVFLSKDEAPEDDVMITAL